MEIAKANQRLKQHHGSSSWSEGPELNEKMGWQQGGKGGGLVIKLLNELQRYGSEGKGPGKGKGKEGFGDHRNGKGKGDRAPRSPNGDKANITCKFWAKNMCSKGKDCPYKHGPIQEQEPGRKDKGSEVTKSTRRQASEHLPVDWVCFSCGTEHADSHWKKDHCRKEGCGAPKVHNLRLEIQESKKKEWEEKQTEKFAKQAYNQRLPYGKKVEETFNEICFFFSPTVRWECFRMFVNTAPE